jgi:serine/threonine-protein kinase haspin
MNIQLVRGNILVSRSDDSAKLQFTLDGRKLLVKTYGLIISIIDFTLSRINTGECLNTFLKYAIGT